MVLSPYVVLIFLLFFVLILGSCFTFLLSLKYDGHGSPLDIRWSGGIVDKCKGEYTFPCWRFNVSRQEVDVVTDQFKHFDSLTVDGRRGTYIHEVYSRLCVFEGHLLQYST